MFGLPKEIAGTIVAAIIAAGISLLGLIISKENKVSEFRQAWIDSLRAEIAAVITHAHSVHGACLATFPDNSALWQNVREDFVELNEAWAKIKLRLNPKEGSSLAVIRALEEHEGLFPDDGTTPDFSKLSWPTASCSSQPKWFSRRSGVASSAASFSTGRRRCSRG